MLPSSYAELACSIARALEVVGERWSLLIVRDSLRGVTRFDDFQSSLGLARNVLSTRLEHLVGEGVLRRQPYGRGRRHDYLLTSKGHELATALIALQQWGDHYYPGPDGPPRLITHADCGGPVTARLVCGEEEQPVAPDRIAVLPGPGAGARLSASPAGSSLHASGRRGGSETLAR